MLPLLQAAPVLQAACMLHVMHTHAAGLDTNKDGVLSGDEIRRGLAEMGVRLTQQSLEKLLRVFDDDGDGEVRCSPEIK